jgi:hypothetical protein
MNERNAIDADSNAMHSAMHFEERCEGGCCKLPKKKAVLNKKKATKKKAEPIMKF